MPVCRYLDFYMFRMRYKFFKEYRVVAKCVLGLAASLLERSPQSFIICHHPHTPATTACCCLHHHGITDAMSLLQGSILTYKIVDVAFYNGYGGFLCYLLGGYLIAKGGHSFRIRANENNIVLPALT